MDHPLDNPAWYALSGPHAGLSLTSGGVKRYRPEISVFVAVENPATADMAGLDDLVPHGTVVGFPVAAAVSLPAGYEVISRVNVVQMVAEATKPVVLSEEMVRLGAANQREMLDLVDLTHPGPFAPETWRMGQYFGIFDGDALVAMAGERMTLKGFVEVSAVCTHPDYRGRGYAKQLVSRVAGDIARQGRTPFLHVLEDNAVAIATYEKLGFATRRPLTFAVAQRS